MACVEIAIGIIVAAVIIFIAAVIIFLIWYFFFNDRDMKLGFYEKFGRGISKYSGKVVWLTGTTTGLGEEIAYQLASVGAKLILSARNNDELERIKAACIEKSKGKLSPSDILVEAFDITHIEEKNVQHVVEVFGKIDVLITNIGHVQLGESSKVELEKEQALFDVNFFGCIYLTKLVVQHFLQAGKGQIVVIASLAGKLGVPGLASYAASKHALVGYFDSLRLEYWSKNISVTIVCPGCFESSISDTTVLTGNKKVSSDEQEKFKSKSMKVHRCAKLTLVAAANRLYEAWFSNQPFLFLMTVGQYCPDLQKRLMHFVFSEKRLEKIYNGKWPGLFTWRPLLAI